MPTDKDKVELTEIFEDIFEDVFEEVNRIYPEFAPYNSSHEAYAVLLEEMDEFWEAVKMGKKEIDEDGRTRNKAMKDEIIQVAAVAIATLKTLQVKYPVKKYAD